MTAYEAADLFLSYLNTYAQFAFGYIGILTAFLVMAFVAAHRLNTVLIFIVLALFTVICAMIVVQMNLIRADMNEVFQYMLRLRADGIDGLSWFGNNPAWMPPLLTLVVNLVSFGGYGGCLLFFFYQRKKQLQ